MKILLTQSKYFFSCRTTDKITELINKAFGNVRTYFISFQENTYQVGVATEEMSVNIRSVKENRLITSGRAEK
jgi:basic membrane lipoprotein Med (substrate-binding protein (PBP1-ABC) superfamily)